MVITLVVLALARSAAAAPCEEYANELRADLRREARRTRVWSWAWRITYTVGAVAQLGIAASGKASRDDEQSLWVGGARERNASNQLAATWNAHISGLIVHGVGTLVLAERVSWKAGLTSFALGYPITLLNIYTMPRASLRGTRDSTWTAGIT